MRLPASAAAGALVAAALLGGAGPATGATRSQLTGFADRAASVWAGRQDARGAFLDPHSGRPAGGYGNVMLGYALLRAGERRHEPRLTRAGVRGVGTALDEPPAARGVFDLLSMAAAYDFARARLAGDPSVAAALPRWEAYLRATGPPNIENKARQCIVSPSCFHNHEAVGATANLELLATGVTAPALGDPAALRRSALEEVGVAEPRFARGAARIAGPVPERGLALLSDTGTWPLAYHALSTAMLGRSVELLDRDAPAASRAALRRTAGALAGLMAPDGSVAYIGRRQEDLWALAAAIAAAELAAAHSGADPAAVARDQAVADRALGRIRARYPLTARGLPIVPRSGQDAFSRRGVDGNPMTFNGLALYLLNVAADAAPVKPAPRASLPADHDGAFVDPAQNGFATVRRGDVWFAVHRRRNPPDLRNDFGLVAAKWRSPSGTWVDVVPPRPLKLDASETAGPVVDRAGQRIVPGGPIRLRSGGAVEVGGPVPLRFAPIARGVRISLRARAGDTVTYTAYLPAGTDPRVAVHASPAPASIRRRGGYASCCDTHMVAARIRVPVRSGRTVSFAIAAPPSAARPASERTGKAGSRWWIAALALAAVALALAARRRAVARRRRRRRRPIKPL